MFYFVFVNVSKLCTLKGKRKQFQPSKYELGGQGSLTDLYINAFVFILFFSPTWFIDYKSMIEAILGSKEKQDGRRN